jgi:hypothetical protein
VVDPHLNIVPLPGGPADNVSFRVPAATAPCIYWIGAEDAANPGCRTWLAVYVMPQVPGQDDHLAQVILPSVQGHGWMGPGPRMMTPFHLVPGLGA